MSVQNVKYVSQLWPVMHKPVVFCCRGQANHFTVTHPIVPHCSGPQIVHHDKAPPHHYAMPL